MVLKFAYLLQKNDYAGRKKKKRAEDAEAQNPKRPGGGTGPYIARLKPCTTKEDNP